MRTKEKPWGILAIPIAILAVLLFLTALNNLDQGRQQEGKRQLEEALRNASMACYAAEGIFPPSLEYLEENYGIPVDHKKYTVIYESIGSNLMPDITVLETKE